MLCEGNTMHDMNLEKNRSKIQTAYKASPFTKGTCPEPVSYTHLSSGWGDGYYPVYFGYDAKGEVCAVYVWFIDIEASYQEQD